jgi:hypothetical protein
MFKIHCNEMICLTLGGTDYTPIRLVGSERIPRRGGGTMEIMMVTRLLSTSALQTIANFRAK